MSDDRSDPSDESTMQLPESATLLLQRERIDAYLVLAADEDESVPCLVLATPFEGGVLLGGAGTESGTADALSVEYGAYQTYSLSDLSQVRDDHERFRDQIRHDHGDTPREQEFDLATLQAVIDIFVIVERTVEYIETDDRSERGRHYHRVSALCDSPQRVLETVKRALDTPTQPPGLLGRLRNTVRQGDNHS